MAAPEYPPRLKVENRWVRKCAVLQVCFGQQGGDLAEIGEISNWPSALMSIMLFDKIPPEWCAKSCHLHWVIVYDFNVWILQKSTMPKSQSPIQGTTKYERLSKYKKKINPSLRCKPGPAIIRVKFPDYKKGICQKLNQSQKARQLQFWIERGKFLLHWQNGVRQTQSRTISLSIISFVWLTEGQFIV